MNKSVVVLAGTVIASVLVLAVPSGCGGGGGSGLKAKSQPSGVLTAPAPIAVKPFDMGQPDVVLLITGRTSGMIEVCNCPGDLPGGGLSRRSGLFISYRNAFKHVLAIDGGDFMIADSQKVTRNEYLLRAYALLKYDALVMGDYELGQGREKLQQLFQGKRLPLLSTNADIKSAGQPQAPPLSFVSRVSSPQVAILSAVEGNSLRYAPSESLKAIWSDNQALLQGVDAAFKEGRLVVVVAHGGDEFADKIAAIPHIGLVIRAHTDVSEPKLRYFGCMGEPIAKVGGNEYVGVIALKLDKGEITKIEYRLEIVDKTWPADMRVFNIYQQYLATQTPQTSSTR